MSILVPITNTQLKLIVDAFEAISLMRNEEFDETSRQVELHHNLEFNHPYDFDVTQWFINEYG